MPEPDCFLWYRMSAAMRNFTSRKIQMAGCRCSKAWFYWLRRRNTFVWGTCALLSALLVFVCTATDKWSSIPRIWGELAEDKGTSFRLQGGYAINHQGSGPGHQGTRGVCLPWLYYPLINRKHLWHQPLKCHHSCCHAELRKPDLEACHLNEVEAVQHVYLTNIPVWFRLLGDI